MSGARRFVLMHGAWHGGWCWHPLIKVWRSRGHAVSAPTLAGMADDRPCGDVDLSTHVDDVAALLEARNLRDVTLVGHSYAGLVITGVGGRMPDRVARLIYLDAFVGKIGGPLPTWPSSPTSDAWSSTTVFLR